MVKKVDIAGVVFSLFFAFSITNSQSLSFLWVSDEASFRPRRRFLVTCVLEKTRSFPIAPSPAFPLGREEFALVG